MHLCTLSSLNTIERGRIHYKFHIWVNLRKSFHQLSCVCVWGGNRRQREMDCGCPKSDKKSLIKVWIDEHSLHYSQAVPSSSARPYATPSKDERAAAAAVVAVVAYANDTDDDSWHWSVPDSSWCWTDDVTLDVRTAMMVIYSYYSFGVYYIYGTIICAVCQWCRRETMTRGRSWLQDTWEGREKKRQITNYYDYSWCRWMETSIFHFHNISLLFFVSSAALFALMPRTRLSWINLSALTKMPCLGRQLK